MTHISPDRVVALADGDEGSPLEQRHLGLCPACVREVSQTAELLAAIRTLDEPLVPVERLEENTLKIQTRISTISRFRRGSRLRWMLLPLAAAATLVLVPQLRDSRHRYAPEVSSQGDLSAEEYDALVRGLAEPLDELQIAAQVLDRCSTPTACIAELTGDELESLLDLLDRQRSG